MSPSFLSAPLQSFRQSVSQSIPQIVTLHLLFTPRPCTFHYRLQSAIITSPSSQLRLSHKGESDIHDNAECRDVVLIVKPSTSTVSLIVQSLTQPGLDFKRTWPLERNIWHTKRSMFQWRQEPNRSAQFHSFTVYRQCKEHLQHMKF